MALQRQMDVLANNMANINTTGFKAETILFEEYVMPVANDSAFADSDQMVSYTQDWATMHDFQSGAITPTGGEFDLALDGKGFLVVQTPDGEERWTRNGALHLDSTGLLVTADGHPVMSEVGELRFASDDTDIIFAADGSIQTAAGSKGRLRIVEFDDAQQLARLGRDLFEGGAPNPAAETLIVQGALERSNVSGVAEMANLIRVSRAYQSLASIMQQQDELRQSAIKRLGTLSA